MTANGESLKNVKACVTFSREQWGYIAAEGKRLGISASEAIRRIIGEARPGFNAVEYRVISRIPANRE